MPYEPRSIVAALALTLTMAISCGVSAEPETAPYRGYRWVKTQPRDAKELLALQQIGEPMNCIPAPGNLDLIVPQDAMHVLDALGVPYDVLAADVQQLVDADYALNAQALQERGSASFFTAYRTITEINAYLDTLDTLPGQPDSLVVKFDAAGLAGTVQGRRIFGVRITSPNNPLGVPKPQFLLTATQHAREWAAASSAMYVADQLARGYGTDPIITQILDNVEFHIIPVLNPDGYVYTFPVAQGGQNQRLWRKNRKPNSGGTFGVDLNRNWGTGWGVPGGSSSSQSSDTYRGTAAFSEPETASIRDYALTLDRLKGHIDFHTYSQLVLSPWGYTTSPPPRNNELAAVTASMIDAIRAPFGTTWIGGQASTTLYVASGVAPDWTFEQRGALAWTYELRDTGAFAFQLPPDQIIPTGIEAFEGVKNLATHIQKRLQIIATSVPSVLTTGLTGGFFVEITTFNGYTLLASSQKLLWRATTSGPFNETPLTGSIPAFSATIPAQPCGTTVQFYVQATASDGLIVRTPQATLYTAATPPCPPCPGDANADRAVTFADITATLTSFGNTGAPGITGDADSSGSVTFADITSTLANFGSTCP